MAQKVTGIIKLQINAAKATASPPVGPALGQHGVNIAAFIKEFNARTKDMEGSNVNAVLTQSGADGGRSGSLSGVDLKLDNASDFLCHNKHLLNKMW